MRDMEDVLCGPEKREPLDDIVDLLYKECWNNGLHTFMISADSDSRVSYKDLFQKSVSLAHYFHAFGARPGQVVAVFTTGSIAAGACILATFFVGATAAIVPTDFKLEEVIKILLTCNPCLIFCDYECLDKVKEAAGALSHGVRIITPRGLEPCVDFNSLLEVDSTGFKTYSPLQQDKNPLVILFVRDSSGVRRSVLLSNSTLKKWVYGIKDGWEIAGSTLLIKCDMNTVTGLCFFLATILGGSTLVNARDESSESLIRALCDFEVSFAYMPPETLLALADFPILAHYDLHKLKKIATSGSYLTPNLQIYLIDKLCQSRIPLVRSFGFSETGLFLIDPVGQTKFGTPNKQNGTKFIKIIDKDSEYFASMVTSGCMYNEEWSSPAGLLLDSNGWMYLGYITMLNDLGWIFVVQRIVQAINKNKDKQAEMEHLEDIFPIKHPALFEAAAVRRPGSVGGEKLLAVVTLPEGAHSTGQDLMKYLLGRTTKHSQSGYGLHHINTVPKLPSDVVNRRLSSLQV